MDSRSKHLSSEERGVIFAEHSRGSSQRVIGAILDRPASTICRELARGRQVDGSYCPMAARQVYDERRTRCRRHRRLVEGSSLHRFVHDHLVHRRWSPAQIAHRLRRMNQGDPLAPCEPRDHLCRDPRPAAWRLEGGDGRGTTAGQACPRAQAHDTGWHVHGPGNAAHYQPP